MNSQDIVEELRGTLQSLEDTKTQLSEQQEYIRNLIVQIQMAELSSRDDRECDGCHRSFPADSVIETEFGYLCQDCFRDRMEIEDKEIYE